MRTVRLETAAAMDELLRLLQEGIDRSTGWLTLPPRQLHRDALPIARMARE